MSAQVAKTGGTHHRSSSHSQAQVKKTSASTGTHSHSDGSKQKKQSTDDSAALDAEKTIKDVELPALSKKDRIGWLKMFKKYTVDFINHLKVLYPKEPGIARLMDIKTLLDANASLAADVFVKYIVNSMYYDKIMCPSFNDWQTTVLALDSASMINPVTGRLVSEDIKQHARASSEETSLDQIFQLIKQRWHEHGRPEHVKSWRMIRALTTCVKNYGILEGKVQNLN